MLTAKGYGFPPKKADKKNYARILSRRAAIMDAYRNLAEQVREIHITAETTIESQILTGDIVESRLEAVIKGAEILSEEFSEDGSCVVTLRVPVFGVTDSLAKTVFKPVNKENFPFPSENFSAKGNYTGLIIDCGDSDLNPVLLPVIRNADNVSIYSYNNLDYDKVISNGMVSYVKKDNGSMLLSRKNIRPLSYTELLTAPSSEKNISGAGSNPLIIRAQKLSDDNSCPVVSTSDADKILAENQITHFLDNGSVVFTSYRIGGTRV